MLKVFGTFARKTIQNALTALSDRLKPHHKSIKDGLSESDCLMMDETPYIMNDKQGYVWVCIGSNGIIIHADRSRSAAVLDLHFPYYRIPITVDGYAGYSAFEIIQRCWAHILRDSEYETIYFDPKMMLLYDRLLLVYHDAKKMQRPVSDADIGILQARCYAIADAYGNKYGEKLRRAVPNLFTFLKYPGMEPTNNDSERALRKAVIHRKIRQRMVTARGMEMFGVLMSCFLTWKKLKLDVTEQVLRLA